jgi:hypothetical protein
MLNVLPFSYKNIFYVRHQSRVARWYIFKQKILIWVHYGGSWNGKGWYILWQFGTFYGHLVIKRQIGIFPPVLVYLVKKNLATLQPKIRKVRASS